MHPRLIRMILVTVGCCARALSFSDRVIELGSEKCPGINFCTRSAVTPSLSKRTCCTPCSCTEDCWYTNTCCPDVTVPRPSYIDRLNFVCGTISATSPNYNSFQRGRDLLLQVAVCSNGYDKKSPEYEKCQGTYLGPLEANDIGMVFDQNRPVIYKNKNCAACNNVTNIRSWDVYARDCGFHDEWLRLAGAELYSYILNECSVFSVPPDDTMDMWPFVCQRSTDTCNTTGLWDVYDQELEEACHFSQFPVHDKSQYHGWTNLPLNYMPFKNIYCLMCNRPKDYNIPVKCAKATVDHHKSVLNIHLASVFNLKMPSVQMSSIQEGNPANTICRKDEIFDPYLKTCRRLICPISNAPVYGKCINNGILPIGYVYEMVFHFAMEDDRYYDTVGIPKTDVDPMDSSGRFLVWLGIQASCDVHSSVVELFSDSINQVNDLVFFLRIYITPRCTQLLMKRNIFEIALRQGRYTITLQGERRSIVLRTVHQIPGMLGSIFTSSDPIFSSFSLPRTIYKTPEADADRTVGYLLLRRLYDCPFVQLNVTEYCQYHDTINASYNFTDIQCNNVSLAYTRGFVKSANKINEELIDMFDICLNDYIPSLSHTPKSTRSTKGLLSILVTCASLFCLITLVLVYIFSDKVFYSSNVFLVILGNMFIAQALFQFGSGWTSEQLPYTCPVIGALIHYFWLASMLAMNSFCIACYMIVQPFATGGVSGKIRCFMYFYTFLVPLLFIIVNIVYSYTTENAAVRDNDAHALVFARIMGYGTYSCYINTPEMRGITFALPMVMLAIVNLGIYSKTVLQLNLSRSQTGLLHQKREYMGVYTRLSTVTGFVWILGIIKELFTSDLFDYMFIIIASGQGVFVVVAFAPFRDLGRALLKRVRSFSGKTETTK